MASKRSIFSNIRKGEISTNGKYIINGSFGTIYELIDYIKANKLILWRGNIKTTAFFYHLSLAQLEKDITYLHKVSEYKPFKFFNFFKFFK